MANWKAERARVAALSRSRTPDDHDLVMARRDLRAARLEDYVARVVSESPPLTDAQRDRRVSILREGRAQPDPTRASGNQWASV